MMDEPTPLGGHNLPPKYAREDLQSVDFSGASSELDKHLLRLLALHPRVKRLVDPQELKSLDDSKAALLQQINGLLGIKPLIKRQTKPTQSHAQKEDRS